jgi:hypothetical protein
VFLDVKQNADNRVDHSISQNNNKPNTWPRRRSPGHATVLQLIPARAPAGGGARRNLAT